MEKANVTWMGKQNQPEPEIDISDPKAKAKRNDDYMNNEAEEIDLETALTSLWTGIEAPQSRTSISLVRAHYDGYLLPSRRWERPQKKTRKKISAENVI